MTTETPEVEVVEVPQLALRMDGVARVLDVSDRTARRLAESGEIESVTLGDGSTRVPYASVMAYIERQRADNAYVLRKPRR